MSLARLLAGHDINDEEFAGALEAVDKAAARIVAAYGVVSTADGFYETVTEFARTHFDHATTEREQESASDTLRSVLTDDDIGLLVALEDLATNAQGQMWRAAWLLGVAAGMQLRTSDTTASPLVCGGAR